jgi:DNA-binding response OmpR family regulator
LQYNFSEALVYLCDPQNHIRHSIVVALQGYGFHTVKDFRTYEDLLEGLDSGAKPDLIICDSEIGGHQAIDLFARIRRREQGNNPFVVAIMTTWNPTPEKVRAITNAGVDDLLSKPLSPKVLYDRVNTLIASRKPFIVTSEYIGPDRRAPSNRSSSAKIFSVPNTLAARAKGEDIANITETIDSIWSGVAEERQVRNSFQIVFLVDLILPALRTGSITADLPSHLDRLVQTCTEATQRNKTSYNPQSTELFERLTFVATAIAENPMNPGQKNIALLKPLAQAIHKSLNPDKDEKKLASEISTALEKYSKA